MYCCCTAVSPCRDVLPLLLLLSLLPAAGLLLLTLLEWLPSCVGICAGCVAVAEIMLWYCCTSKRCTVWVHRVLSSMASSCGPRECSRAKQSAQEVQALICWNSTGSGSCCCTYGYCCCCC